MGLALYLARVRSSELLDGIPRRELFENRYRRHRGRPERDRIMIVPLQPIVTQFAQAAIVRPNTVSAGHQDNPIEATASAFVDLELTRGEIQTRFRYVVPSSEISKRRFVKHL